MDRDPAEDALDARLLREIGAGNAESLATFYDRHAAVLFATAYRILGNQSGAEDVLQEALVQLWQKAPLFDGAKGRALTWAITLTRNKALDRVRSIQRRSRLSEESMREAEIFEEKTDRSAFEIIVAGEAGELVRGFLERLPEDQRRVIELAYFASLTTREIGERLGEPVGTVKARLRRAMMRLRELARHWH